MPKKYWFICKPLLESKKCVTINSCTLLLHNIFLHRYVAYVCLCMLMEGALRLPSLYHPYLLKNHWIGLPTSPWAAGHHSDPPVRMKDWKGNMIETLARSCLTFLGWLSHLLTGQMTLHLRDQKVILNDLAISFTWI